MHRNALIAIGLSWATFPGTPVLAQDTLSTDELLRTRHVRIAAPAVSPGWLTGHLLTIDSVAYVMQTIRPEAWRIPRHQVTAIQIGAGRGPTESILRGAGIGALVGGGLLLTYEALVYGPNDMFGLVAFLIGVPVGGLAGAVVGSQQSDLEWVDVEVGAAGVQAQHRR